jgi:SM-20-related protein
MSGDESIRNVIRQLDEQGWAQCERFMKPEAIAELSTVCRQGMATQRFHQAGIGRGKAWQQRADIRSDLVCWMDENDEIPAWQNYQERLEKLRTTVNKVFFLGLHDFEGHLAVYPPGTLYRRHLDQFANAPERRLTAILYLNENWTAEDWGQLRMYLENGDSVDIYPEAGRFVTFLSDRFEHEVLPARRERLALTGWFRRRALYPVW